jgi:hypothetical protein
LYTFILIIVILILLAYDFFYCENVTEPLDSANSERDDYHVVCARYNKPVDFLDNIDLPHTIVQKGVDVPNIANEATSFLFYIITNYEKLPKNMIFIHDEDESWHHDGKITENVHTWINEFERSDRMYFEFNNMESGRDGTNMDIDLYEKNATFRDYWDTCLQDHVGNYNEAMPVRGKCCAQFIVSRNRIWEKTKDFYERLYNWLLEETDGEGNGAPENEKTGYNTSRYAEWTWRYILGSSQF